MRRFPAFDPPEYVSWRPEPELVAQFQATLAQHPERAAIVAALTDEQLLDLYRGLLRARLHDIALKRWVRTGVLSKAWLGTGEEATTVGPVHALQRTGHHDIVAPMIRNAAACCEMGMPIAAMLRAYLASADSPSAGRDLHVGDMSRGVLPPISHVGDMVPVIAGIALAFKARGERRVALTWVGDGSTKAGATHEGTNFAAVQRLPVILIVQNNQVALGTRLDQHHVPADFSDWAATYGIAGATFDGNNVLDAYAATRLAADRCRQGDGPAMLIAETFRMGGHATHDEREARDTFAPELFAEWGKRDPVGLYEEHLKALGWSERELQEVEQGVTVEIEQAERDALASRERMPDGPTALTGVYANNSSRGA
jgi:TPP-dependent pyruvate/acetoin dehydrogenase alpha subunit